MLQLTSNEELPQLRNQQQAGKLLIIDVRSPAEYAREHIPGSRNMPVDTFDAQQLCGLPYETILFHCRSGIRTQQNAHKFEQVSGAKLLCLSGGIEQWKKAGLPTVMNKKAPLDIMRQVQIIAGSLMLAFSLLALFVSPLFTLGSAAVGAGLMFAGITGICGLAKLLLLLPYNKTQKLKTTSCHTNTPQHGCCG